MLDRVFTPEVLARLRARQNPSAALKERLMILESPNLSASGKDSPGWIRYLRARRDAWERYVSEMHGVGLLDDDVTARLGSDEDHDFRGAKAECLTCYFLRSLNLTIGGRADGRAGKRPDFAVALPDGGALTLEVKSPYTEPPSNTTFSADYAQLVEPLIDQANRQFAAGRVNVLAIVPFTQVPVLTGVRPYLKAFYGEHKITFEIDTKTGRAVSEPRQEFFPDGKFLKLWPEPRYTRTGAVLRIREHVVEEGAFEEEGSAETRLSWFVLHNPHAQNPVPQRLWADGPQMIKVGDGLRWTDDAKIYRD